MRMKIRKRILIGFKKIKNNCLKIVRLIKIKYYAFEHYLLTVFLKSIPLTAKFVQQFNNFIFSRKKVYLSLMCLVTVKAILLQIVYLGIVCFISYAIFKLSEKHTDLISILYTLLGAILSMYVTYVFTVISHLLKAIKYQSLSYQDIASMQGCIDAVFKSFMSYPLNDDFCKRGENIIYIAPMKAGGGYDELKLIEYTNIINNISYDDFYKYFDERTTRFLISQLKSQSFIFNNTYSTILHRQDLIDKDCFLLFSQFYQLLMEFIYMDYFLWKDEQIKQGLYVKFKALIYKINMSIIVLQREMRKFKRFVDYNAHQPEKDRIKLVNYLNNKMEKYKKMHFKLLRKVSKLPKSYWNKAFEEMLKYQQTTKK
jgi:hypothetical protein